MKQFIKKVLVFLIPIILIGVWAEYSIRQINNVYKFKRDYLQSHADNVEVLILGSSHAFYNINPEYFKRKAFNAGAVSQSLDLDYEILKTYGEKLSALKTIVLPVSSFSFYGRLKDSEERWRIKDYVLYYDFDLAGSVRDYSEVLSIRPKNNLKKIIANYKQPLAINSSTLGWGTAYRTQGPKSLNVSGVEAALRHTYTSGYSNVFQNGVQDVKHIIDWADQHKVNVLLVFCPAYKTYTNHLDINQLKLVRQSLQTLADNSKNTTYLDVLTDDQFDETDFYDADHLNHKGAKKLSVLISETIR